MIPRRHLRPVRREAIILLLQTAFAADDVTMVNHHFGKFADVWKHLVLLEVLSLEGPQRYAETHAGSAANPMVDDTERRFGVLGFLELAAGAPILERSRYRTVLNRLGDVREFYPGSGLLAMRELGNETAYLLCDLDPSSAADLRGWSANLGIDRCEVLESDGISATSGWLNGIDSTYDSRTVVHIDPFDPHLPGSDGRSSLDLAVELITSRHGLVYWYGYSRSDQSAWAYQTLYAHTRESLWCGDMMLVDGEPGIRDGDLGNATTVGTGCGIVLANVADRTLAACTALGEALATAYAGSTFPNGSRGDVVFRAHGPPADQPSYDQ